MKSTCMTVALTMALCAGAVNAQDWHGSSNRIGQFTFYDFHGPGGQYMYGSSNRIGQFTFYDFSVPGPSMYGISTDFSRNNRALRRHNWLHRRSTPSHRYGYSPHYSPFRR